MSVTLARKLARHAAFIATAVALLAAMPAHADSPDINPKIDRAASVPSRAEVRAEQEEAHRDGTSNVWTGGYHDVVRPPSAETRAEVPADARADRRMLKMKDDQDKALMTLLSPKYQEVSTCVA